MIHAVGCLELTRSRENLPESRGESSWPTPRVDRGVGRETRGDRTFLSGPVYLVREAHACAAEALQLRSNLELIVVEG
jgi:hypothetical protein